MNTERSENVLTGLVGAFLGSLIGVACIVGIGQLGYVASFSGVIMAVCAIKGYSLLGGTISRKGAVIACVLTLVMTYFGNRLDFAVTVARAAEVDVFTAFQAIGDLLDAGYLNGAAYWGNLVLLYLFTLLGAVPTLIAAFRQATPVSMPQENVDGISTAASTETAEQSSAQLYPFGGLSWTRRLRLSLCLPILVPVAAMIGGSLFLSSHSEQSLHSLCLGTAGRRSGPDHQPGLDAVPPISPSIAATGIRSYRQGAVAGGSCQAQPDRTVPLHHKIGGHPGS